MALVNAGKQKLWMALIGVVFWPAAAVTAVRLAQPESIWARVFYRGDKLVCSKERYPSQTE